MFGHSSYASTPYCSIGGAAVVVPPVEPEVPVVPPGVGGMAGGDEEWMSIDQATEAAKRRRRIDIDVAVAWMMWRRF